MGAIVMSVTAEEGGKPTPAAKMGMQASDIIVEYEGAPVNNAQDLIQRVASTPVVCGARWRSVPPCCSSMSPPALWIPSSSGTFCG